MSRVVIKLKDGSHINVVADALDLRDGMVMAWNGDFLVAIVSATEMISCHISEAK